ncbi:hypothetical protein [Streptomyces sp. NPDC058572]|uniref:hypothetical protein n=1 Tax=Streptomyces sp. NPDC058572 TaxID=3346546 RepID=UPI003653E9FC
MHRLRPGQPDAGREHDVGGRGEGHQHGRPGERARWFAVVPDSSSITVDPAFEGERLVVGCSPEHRAELVEQYERRPFVAELWAGRMAWAMFWYSGEVSEDELVAETGLSPEQIEQAVAWHNVEVERRRKLRDRAPGGEQ